MTQDDILLPQLTVEETLVFSAFLRLPSDMSLQQKYAKVEMIMKELGLERYASSALLNERFITFFFPRVNYMICCITTDVVTQELGES